MPQIVWGPPQASKIDPSVKKLVQTFLEKLNRNDTTPGLHIEPLRGTVDDRVRTGRVNEFWRAVLVKLQGQGSTAHYVYLGTYPHDEAITFAKRARLTVNPVNGIAELIMATEPERRDVPAAAAPAPPVDEPAAAPLLPSLGITREILLDEVGLAPDLVERALAATGEDEVLALAETAVQWQGLVLIDLAGGTPVEIATAALGIARGGTGVTTADALVQGTTPETGEVGDERVLQALRHPAAQMQFAFIEDDAELRRAIDESSFAAWRTFLHPEQRRYATAAYKGPFRLSGGAGTGKTVVLLHRARALARRNPQARILLTTYTRTLAQSLRNDLQRLDPELPIATSLGQPGIHVAGIDAAVHAVVSRPELPSASIEAVLGVRSPAIANRTQDNAWSDAADGVDVEEELRTRTFLVSEYAMVVLPGNITTRDEYFTVRRPGRGVALDRRRRAQVWDIVQSYRAQASVDGSIDFAEAASVAAADLKGRGPTVDHVLVDEGQDLTPSHWQFLRALAAEGPDDLFIAEDSHQRIYGQRVVLGRYGIRIVGRSQRLTLNYRTTAENLQYAVSVLEGGDYHDLEDEAERSSGYRSARTGPRPRVMVSNSLGEELEVAADVVREWTTDEGAAETVGLLVRDQQTARRLSAGLKERGVPTRFVDGRSADGPHPRIMTMHRAKGMEFAKVLIFGVDDGAVPAEYLLRGVPAADRDDALLRERSLLYVAATRARDELVLTSSRRSGLLPRG